MDGSIMRYAPIDPKLFIQNRQRLVKSLEPSAVAVFNAGDVLPTSADGIRSFVQQTDLFYLCGLDQEETVLVLCPGASQAKHRELLFIRQTSDDIAQWEGHKLSREEAARISGIATVYWTTEFDRVFRTLVLESERIYLNSNEHEGADRVVETRDARFIQWCRKTFPLHRYRRLAPMMHNLRAVKSDIEVGLIREACRITEKAFRRVLGFMKPGRWEFEVEAEIVCAFIKNRSRRPAYAPIIASGADACVLHYVKNDKKCQDGQLVLMDFGAEYANYAADMTRTIPVNGRFTPRQRAVYEAVLRVHRQAVQMLVPGNTLEAYHQQVGQCMERELIALGLLEAAAVKDQDAQKPLYKQFFMHGTSHHLGLDVHDYGRRNRAFEPGMVLTCEPGIYIRKEGIGVRIENDILITEQAPVDLMASIPIEAEEIESLMSL
jgi:Xaa-Pro aminopeptidase